MTKRLIWLIKKHICRNIYEDTSKNPLLRFGHFGAKHRNNRLQKLRQLTVTTLRKAKMMRSLVTNPIIIIGGDHHNTLAVLRCLGKFQCNLQLLVHTSHTESETIFISHSRYAAGNIACVEENTQAILQWLLEHKTGEKQILFPCSDLAAYAIDTNYQTLCDHFLLPGFQSDPGNVARLMDKWEQSKFAASYGLPMAKTWELTAEDGFRIPKDLCYPCIVKPEISAFGSKSDIVICDTAQQLADALKRLEEAQYKALVVQQFLHKQYEVCNYGCLVGDKALWAGGSIRKVREFPPRGGGSLTYAQFIDEEAVNTLRDRILNILYELGYRGQYDIEFLVCSEGVYLNEINFRHSGNGYGLIQNGVYAPYIWVADAAGVIIPKTLRTQVKTGKYHMDELSDFYHLKHNHVSYLTWFCDCLRTSAFAKLDFSDLKGSFVYYVPVFKSVLRKLFSFKRS